MRYPAEFQPDDPGFLVVFPDVPEAVTGASSMEATRVLAVDALETALEFYFEDNRKIPAPSSLKPKMEWVYLGPTMTAKVLLHNEMLEQGIDAEELRRRMSTSLKKIRHILDPRHMTKIEQMDAAFRALGKSIQLQLVSRD